ncbi:DUF2007 domain-containing protein [Saccharicrinis sp. FJH2]|uniref:putative signal transducing protein n=1 Tax=Saccharicrinis sp. FJH65 TaxID=3344659 RepID=UPI0035F37631
MNLKTIHISNMPVECHILKGRLESEGIECYIFDENLVWVHPFRSVAIGGVKLKVPEDQYDKAKQVLQAIQDVNLVDETGSYAMEDAVNGAMEKEDEILHIKSILRHDPELLDQPEKIARKLVTDTELADLIIAEKQFLKLSHKDKTPSIGELIHELTDFNFDVLKNLRPNPTEYYLDKEDVENFTHQKKDFGIVSCPHCASKNVRFDDAIDYKWDIPYLFFSLITMVPFPPIRHKYHCFNCGKDFKVKHQQPDHNQNQDK